MNWLNMYRPIRYNTWEELVEKALRSDHIDYCGNGNT